MTKATRPTYSYPWSTDVGGLRVRFRKLSEGDLDAMLAFTRQLPERDKLFLRTDITDPAVVQDWIENVTQGKTVTVLAEAVPSEPETAKASSDEEDAGTASTGQIVAYGSLHHSEILWTRHLGEMRLLVGSAFRGKGVGGRLAEQLFSLAQDLGLLKLVAQMMSTQRSAQNLFHHLEFIPEALLHDWVIDQNGRTHDLILMSREVDHS